MPTSIIKAMPSSSQAHGTLMNLVATTGWTLTSAFAGLFVICYLLSFVWPTSGLAHGWMGPAATHPDNFARTFVGAWWLAPRPHGSRRSCACRSTIG
jgi:hypothetical protein